ncbi:asparaginase [Aspergillus neoniger CBS 115656]|uniref:Thermolabile L-asparaginase n=1 Tax=Aspergillus neoniger (strain CBS 115656) TaxID=1448310 RepID=A0A318Y3K8_ASPNB|nr:thermolabile L-asparaginase [Aspergillus neoniger CBS 115656]PYH28389.1 thermolabile L-asparaginase [Aspergillus neoniger CBS 115656]
MPEEISFVPGIYRLEKQKGREHQFHAAVTDATGRIIYAVGNPTRVTLARSAAKPAQALAVLETGALEKFDFDEADLALMCASHSSEDRHLARARAMLAKIDLQEENLRCGGHAALSESVNRAWIKRDWTPTAIANNCSGKHAGMLAGAKALGAPPAEYHCINHPLQQQVTHAVEELAGLPSDRVQWAIDGCNLPAPALPLQNLASIYARIANAANAAPTDHQSPRAQALACIFRAMAGHPELVGGDGRFCTALMRAFEGVLIGKVGADGCYAIGVRASGYTQQLGISGALGIAVKIEDGNRGVLYAVAVEILRQLQIATPAQLQSLEAFHQPVIRNTAGVVTGHTSHQFQISSV